MQQQLNFYDEKFVPTLHINNVVPSSYIDEIMSTELTLADFMKLVPEPQPNPPLVEEQSPENLGIYTSEDEVKRASKNAKRRRIVQQSEQKRRNRINEKFDLLKDALVSSGHDAGTKERILEEAFKHIKTMEAEVAQEKKMNAQLAHERELTAQLIRDRDLQIQQLTAQLAQASLKTSQPMIPVPPLPVAVPATTTTTTTKAVKIVEFATPSTPPSQMQIVAKKEWKVMTPPAVFDPTKFPTSTAVFLSGFKKAVNNVVTTAARRVSKAVRTLSSPA
eukprot:TRINITY_DN2188_c0_g1_i1.p1 TRINITY_DN2188_c0_g1~~TRINITY_DN2188_c0_g1_i1.p1  ORF type:complete len:277 (+),score=54.26 TRINITY_DN2188_c0_g1_i1:112-942(+)